MTANLRSNAQASNCDIPSIRILKQESQVAHDAQPTRQLSNGANLLFFGRGRRQPSAVMVATNKLTGLQIKWNNTCGWLCKQTVVMLAHCKHFTPYLHRPLALSSHIHPRRESKNWEDPNDLYSTVQIRFFSQFYSLNSVRIYDHSLFIFYHPYFLSSLSTSLISTSPLYTRVGTLIVATIYLQLIQTRYMFRSFTVLQCSHQHCVQTVSSDVGVVGYL